jgi:hypothetical protein
VPLGLVLALVLGAAGTAAAGLYDPRATATSWLGALPWVSPPSCPRTTVNVAVSPDMAPAVAELIRPLDGRRLPGGSCLHVSLLSQEPAATLSGVTVLPRDRWPHLWIPDSSVWLARTGDLPVETVGRFASSPLVVATSAAAADSLGWKDSSPSWAEALTGLRAVAVPDLSSTAEGLLALLALRTSVGDPAKAKRAVAATVLAAGRAQVPTVQAAFETATAGKQEAPLIPASEQAVVHLNAGDTAEVVAVYPRDGSPVLDYPLLRVAPQRQPPAVVAGVRAITASLTAESASQVLRRYGFRDPSGAGPSGAGVQGGAVTAMPLPGVEVVQGLLGTLADLAAPSRVLAVLDVSQSMSAPAGPGQTRISLARDAAQAALGLFPDRSKIGVWAFASDLAGSRDWTELAPVAPLGQVEGGATQRERLAELLVTLPDQLRPGGTALYQTSLDAVRALQKDYDPAAVSSVVLITDGANEDSRGPTLDEVVGTLKAEAKPDRPVRLIAVGLGPDANLSELTRIAESTGGSAYQATNPQQLQAVLFDALSRRP